MEIKDLMQELVKRRHGKGLRQVDIAEKMGIGQPAVSELESGKTNPRMETLASYASAVGVSLVLEVVEDHELSTPSHS